jgi:hypothetical protein
MESILIGNGVNIQFGGKDHLNESIIKRAIANITVNDLSNYKHASELKEYFLLIEGEFLKIIKGNYDRFAYAEKEKITLDDFKFKYGEKPRKIYNIGFEDIFLMHRLICRLVELDNPTTVQTQGAIRDLFIDSIFNKGKVNQVYINFPKKLITDLMRFDEIYTTNYDRNIELATNKNVKYLHGAFHIIKDIYNSDSLRNKLPDRPIDSFEFIDGCNHIYSTALTIDSSDSKSFVMNMHKNANEALIKVVTKMKEDPEYVEQIERWKNDDNKMVRNLYWAIINYLKDPSVSFNDYYPSEEFKKIKGRLITIGLSPFNDFHIFRMINDNLLIDEVKYYFYSDGEIELVEKLVKNHKVEFCSVIDYWKECTT